MVMSCTIIPFLKLYQLIFQSVGRQKLWGCTTTEPAQTCFEQIVQVCCATDLQTKSVENRSIKHNRNPKDLSDYFYTPPKFNIAPEKWVVGRLLSF